MIYLGVGSPLTAHLSGSQYTAQELRQYAYYPGSQHTDMVVGQYAYCPGSKHTDRVNERAVTYRYIKIREKATCLVFTSRFAYFSFLDDHIFRQRLSGKS